jgi:hypothetical protein
VGGFQVPVHWDAHQKVNQGYRDDKAERLYYHVGAKGAPVSKPDMPRRGQDDNQMPKWCYFPFNYLEDTR